MFGDTNCDGKKFGLQCALLSRECMCWAHGLDALLVEHFVVWKDLVKAAVVSLWFSFLAVFKTPTKKQTENPRKSPNVRSAWAQQFFDNSPPSWHTPTLRPLHPYLHLCPTSPRLVISFDLPLFFRLFPTFSISVLSSYLRPSSSLRLFLLLVS